MTSKDTEVIPRGALARLEVAGVALVGLPVGILMLAILAGWRSGSKGLMDTLLAWPSEILILALVGGLTSVASVAGLGSTYRARVALVLVLAVCGSWLLASLAAAYGLSIVGLSFIPE